MFELHAVSIFAIGTPFFPSCGNNQYNDYNDENH